MKILLLNSWYYPNLKGGAEHSVKLLAENLASRGHTVAVFTIDSERREMTTGKINEVVIYRGTGGQYNIRKAYRPNKPIWESLKNKILEIRNYSVIKELSKVYQDFYPDIVHVNCIAGMSMSAILYFHTKGVPIVYTLRDYFLDSPTNVIESATHGNFPKKIALSLYRHYTKKKSAYVDAVTAPSFFTLNYYINNGYFSNAKLKERIVNSVEVNETEVEKYMGDKEKHPHRNFMYAGSITETKGVIPMLHAFMQTKIDTTLYVCGTGNLFDYVVECSKKDARIKPMGKLSPADLACIYKQSDIMLVPSIWAEPFGRVVIEAAKYGLYVIGSPNGGIPEIIKEMGCGEICEVNETELKKSIEKVYQLDFQKAHSNILENIGKYSITHQIESFEVLYSKLKK